jgi:Flp pilus assembly protein TadB
MNIVVVCGLAFVSLLGLALAALLYPGVTAERAEKRNRLTEVSRYRVLSAVGGDGPAPAPAAPVEGEMARKTLALVDRMVRARGQRSRLVSQLERSGLRMRPEEWAAIQIAVVVASAAVLAFLLSSPLGVIPGAVLGWGACWAFVRFKSARRCAAFEAGLPDSLQLLSGALRAGFTLNQAIGSVAREGNEPAASEFSRVLTEVRLGAELEDSLDALAVRLKSYDMTMVVMAIRTAREVGGNLAEVLQTTAGTIRERVQLRRQVDVLSAEGRLSAKVLVALPILLGVYLLLFRKGYLNPLVHTGTGIGLLIAGVALLLLGSFWLSRIVKIEV